MKKYLLLPIAAAFMVSPALAQTSTNSSNIESREEQLQGAKESAQPGPAGAGMGAKTDTSADTTNSGNMESRKDQLEGAKQSAEPGAPGSGQMQSDRASDTGNTTNSSNLESQKDQIDGATGKVAK